MTSYLREIDKLIPFKVFACPIPSRSVIIHILLQVPVLRSSFRPSVLISG